VPLPAKLGAAGAPGAIVTAGGLVFVGGGDVALNAVDAMTGETLWRFPFAARTTATPMTYKVDDKQYVVIAIGQSETAELVAFALN
jgi:glucose dehydrogenase